ncbi:uncharacterized protein LOC119523258 [Choloepus didactylus]|uniref:uncharacterized protein LOC119523258 n=1 Tax=Choloepus didactylus TaxID=27675 RepID=UPI00189D21E9|nr:uncharacterized protein LOC119523258 [Choloepus didactylus]XP_037677957.1 uncharacterized protein LOC119523258 [Choloepus didactylus]XP_037677958.1 uncharacterized protein LOC119523258 [Choloepus didactylus]
MPECPYPLVGRDLLHKLRATISFQDERPEVNFPRQPSSILITCPLSKEYLLLTGEDTPKQETELLIKWQKEIPEVWAETNPPGLAGHQPPIVAQLLSHATPVRIQQYPMSYQAKKGIAVHIKRLREAGILVPCKSPWNTPLLPVQKPGTEDFRPVQDLREVNKRVEMIHPMVPNPYTLLSLLPPDRKVYTVLDLKDALFSLPLALVSQPLFAFEWTDPEVGDSGQLTWTRLPQGFKNSPTLFDEALSQDLLEFWEGHPEVTVLQYVDDILLAAKSPKECQKATKELLKALRQLGYRVSAKKAQLCVPQSSYLGYNITEGKRALSNKCIQAILQILTPQTKLQVLEFLGVVRYCRLWILGFAEIACPLYASTGGKDIELTWTDKEEGAFRALKKALTQAPALALPDLRKPFQLHVAEAQGAAKGVLTQRLGPWKQVVAYLSKRLNPVVAGWPNCLWAIVATALLIKEASKLTFGQELQIIAPHAVETLLKSPPDRWLSNTRITQHQVLLLDPFRIKFLQTSALNPATLLPENNPSQPIHNCVETLAATTNLREDLTDLPLQNPDETLYTDGSSFIQDRTRVMGAAVVTASKLFQEAKEVSRRCHVCTQVNPSHVSTPATPGHRLRGQLPGEQWEIGFTELPPRPGGYKYLLVLVDTFSGWVEAYPTQSESAQVVANKLLAEIIPWFGLPVTMGSDNGLAFIAQVTQNLVKALGIEWKLHCIYRPQSSGKVQRMNRTLKETLTKLKLETGRNWVSLLPFALLKARCTPYVKGITPYEAMFGRPPPLLPKLGEEQLASLSNSELLKSLQALHYNSKNIHHTVHAHRSKPDAVKEETPTAEPGDLVWIKKRDPSSLEARWAGPYQVILSTPTTVKVAGKRFWIHHSQIKRADSDQNAEWVVQKTSDPLKLWLW